MKEKAYFHLPGLFEFYELYRMFLPLFREHREYFYDWCEIGSIYGAPADCIWGGGRAGFGENDPEEVLELMQELARSGMTMVVVTHEMGFARELATRVLFIDVGKIQEENSPKEFFANPKNKRLREFLSKTL